MTVTGSAFPGVAWAGQREGALPALGFAISTAKFAIFERQGWSDATPCLLFFFGARAERL